MLEELSIRNYALIEELSITFKNGLNILTGETGAGKSIVVGALSFIMGAKTDTAVIRSGAQEATVSAVISASGENRDFYRWLEARGIAADEGTVIVRRTIRSTGRSQAYLQNIPLSRGDLEEAMALLFDLHGQHSHETLLHKENHRRYLDSFGGLEGEALSFNRVFTELSEKRRVLERSKSNEKDREERLELLRYQIEEIRSGDPRPGETAELEAEATRLASFEKLKEAVNTAAEALLEGQPSFLNLLRRGRTALFDAAALDSELLPLSQRLESLYFEGEDLAEELRAYLGGLRSDPQRLEEVEERLALLYRLRKKYGSGVRKVPGEEDALLAYKAAAEAEVEMLLGAEEQRGSQEAEITALEQDALRRAAALGIKRKAAALTLGTAVTAILSRLGMPNARFSVAVAAKIRTMEGEKKGPTLLGPWGAEDVEFLIAPNPGEPERELARIASGGELSRVMLAIKTVLSGQDTLETLIFDEIDTGIGGEVALAVGDYLEKIGAIKQIFCVTHLAVIAVRADNHLRVEKRSEGGRTMTGVTALSPQERQEEIARMLAGDKAERTALAHAEELLSRYGKRAG
jgi:DNA repair protein RecN (Recombination protein N)